MLSEADTLQRFLLDDTPVRGELVHLDETWKAMSSCADYPPVVKQLLGETVAAVALLAATIKFNGQLIVQVRGDGPINLLVVHAESDGAMRGIANWEGEIASANPKQAFGDAQLVITIEPDEGEPYQGIVPLEGDSISEVIEYYFQQSEQLNTRLWISVTDEAIGGLLLQELPNDDRGGDAWSSAELLANTIKDDELINLSSNDILHRLYHEYDVRTFDKESIFFRCTCSAERMHGIVKSLGEAEVRDILQEQGKVQIDCHFCNSQYRYDAIEIEMMFNDSVQPSSDTPQ